MATLVETSHPSQAPFSTFDAKSRNILDNTDVGHFADFYSTQIGEYSENGAEIKENENRLSSPYQ
jgi:hypothetical protein